jgi:hypothetical protein
MARHENGELKIKGSKGGKYSQLPRIGSLSRFLKHPMDLT